MRVDVERYRVELHDDDYAIGGEQPLVTVVIFSDYACGPCGVLWQVMKNLEEDYGDDLRVVHRGVGIAGFKDGERAAEAAYAAGNQGKFWSMHWRLFKHQEDFSRPALMAHAKAIGLDVGKLEADLDEGSHSGRRLRDRRQAMKLGVNAAPIVFVNGMVFVGPRPDEAMWHSLIDAEIDTVRERLAAGGTRQDLYAALQEGTLERPLPKPEAVKKLRQERAEKTPKEAKYDYSSITKPRSTERYAVPVKEAALLGPENAPVTIVEFMDYQCPVCRKQHRQSMMKVREQFGNQVRFAILNFPLEMHREARPAAIAALAAGRQGRYFDFHDRFFAPEAVFDRLTYVKWAADLGLDVERFKADLDDPALAEGIEKDRLLSYKLGITATPTMFVNGYFIEGFASGTSLARLIEAEIKLAKQAGGGTVPENYFQDLMAQAIPESEFPNNGDLKSSPSKP